MKRVYHLHAADVTAHVKPKTPPPDGITFRVYEILARDPETNFGRWCSPQVQQTAETLRYEVEVTHRAPNCGVMEEAVEWADALATELIAQDRQDNADSWYGSTTFDDWPRAVVEVEVDDEDLEGLDPTSWEYDKKFLDRLEGEESGQPTIVPPPQPQARAGRREGALVIIPLFAWHPLSPETEDKWRALGTRPLLSVDVDGRRHTVSRNAGLREGRLAALDSDTGNRVYVVGHESDSDALDVALATPVVRSNYRRFPEAPALFLDADDGSDPPTSTFGRRYEADGDDLAEKDFDELHWVDATQAYYDLDTGYGPTWARNAVPPVEAIAGLIAAYMQGGLDEIDIEARPGHTVITIGALSIKAPPFRFGSGAESIPTLVARMTIDKFECEFLAEPKAAAYAVGYNSAGFWHWFARAALAAGLRALFVSERNPDTLTLRLDSRCCSGDDGPSWGVGSEPLVP